MNKEMYEVFMPHPSRAHPLLPFGEYVVKSGKHTLCRELEKSSQDHEHLFMAKYEFPNGHTVSVISGELFYCDEGRPYEVMWETDPDESDVFGYQTDEQLMLLLAKVHQLEKIK